MEIKLGLVLKRVLVGHKLKDVATATGISISLLSDWKEGVLPSGKNIDKLYLLAEYFNLSLEELLFNIKEPMGQSIILQSTQFLDGENQYRIIIEKLK